MTPTPIATNPWLLRQRMLRGLLTLALAAGLAIGCGGGGDGGVGTGGTGSYASGPINGFGSVIVNGVRFDDTNASVLNEDGDDSSSAALRLGMVVEIDGGNISLDANGQSVATANTIRFGSELVGPVTSVDVAGNALVVLAQPVRVNATTVFDDRIANRLAGLAPGSLVEIYGFYDQAGGGFVATRVEPRGDAPDHYKVRGPLSSLNLDGSATLRIGSQIFNYGGADDIPSNLANGLFVRLRVQTATNGAGQWVVTRFGTGTRALGDRDEAEIEGLISTFASSASFSVNGQPVQSSGATEFPDGSAGLALGVRVEVEGPLVAGVIQATRVEIETEEDTEEEGVELKGSIESIDTLAKSFVLRGVTVNYTLDVLDDGLTELQLSAVPRPRVEVKGTLSADGARVSATRVRIDDDD